MGLTLIYYGQDAFRLWDSSGAQLRLASQFYLVSQLQQMLPQIPAPILQLGLLLGVSILTLINPQLFLSAIAILISLNFGRGNVRI